MAYELLVVGGFLGRDQGNMEPLEAGPTIPHQNEKNLPILQVLLQAESPVFPS
jgi:hypothetical protein